MNRLRQLVVKREREEGEKEGGREGEMDTGCMAAWIEKWRKE